MDEEAERQWFWRRVVEIGCESDPTPVKCVLAIGAFVIGAGFWFDRACSMIACAYLEQAFAWPLWAVLWTLYALLITWRVFDTRPRSAAALFINSFGVFLYSGISVGSIIARWPHWPPSSGGVALTLAAFWVLARTKINSGHGIRGD